MSSQAIAIGGWAALLALLCACSPSNAYQTALTATAQALAELDASLTPRYEEAAHSALDESSTREEYDARMQGWNRLEEAMRICRVSLLSSQDALDVWKESAGAESTFWSVLPSLLGALRDLGENLQSLDVPIPGDILEALRLLEGLEPSNG